MASRTMKPEFREAVIARWEEALATIFPGQIPTKKTFTKRLEIIEALDPVAVSGLNYTFLPDRGGYDLVGIALGAEAGTIELHWGPRFLALIKVKKMVFYGYQDCLELSHFMLHCDTQEPAAEPGTRNEYRESVTELSPGSYAAVDEEEDDPRLRRVSRYFKGKIAVFCKGSLYNLLNGPEDGYLAQHETFSEMDFEERIQTMRRALLQIG